MNFQTQNKLQGIAKTGCIVPTFNFLQGYSSLHIIFIMFRQSRKKRREKAGTANEITEDTTGAGATKKSMQRTEEVISEIELSMLREKVRQLEEQLEKVKKQLVLY